MAFKSLKNHITSLASGFVSNQVSNFLNAGSQKDAGKVSAQLLKKGPFDIPDSPSAQLVANPLSFSPVQYPLDLGNNELGHYILFESGFLKYDAQISNNMFETSNAATGSRNKITSKTPSGSFTTSAIALYMPPAVKVSYNQSYDADTEVGLTGDLAVTGADIVSATGAAAKVEAALAGVIGGTVREAKKILGEFVSIAGLGDPVRFIAKRTGTAVNPRNEAFYNTPTQRTFSFTFDFWPRNKKEAEAVDKIIAIFKYNSAPGFQEIEGKPNTAIFSTPNYFKISYMYNNGENPHLNKIGACYCTDVEVDYAPDGQWTTFGGEAEQGGGMPVHTKLTVNFLEDRIITKRDIEAGA